MNVEYATMCKQSLKALLVAFEFHSPKFFRLPVYEEFAFWSRVEGRGPRVTSRGSRVNGRGSKNPPQLFLIFFFNLKPKIPK